MFVIKYFSNFTKGCEIIMSSFHVNLVKKVDDSYDIVIGNGVLDEMCSFIKEYIGESKKNIAIVTDSNVNRIYGINFNEKIKNTLPQCKIITIEIPAGEKSKTRKMKEFVEDEMIKNGFRRDTLIIAHGGGVVTDLAGFVAGTFARGVPFINYATTLLAAADASVGGKTAVDTDVATNLIGLIYQPKRVFIDTQTWETLNQRDISGGLAETIKHACMADKEFFQYLEENIEKVFNMDKEVCRHIAEKNCEIKYNVVMIDEKEQGLREILNLGHTVGRAIETQSDYTLSHGEAVSIGLVAQAMLGLKYGFISKTDFDRILNLLKKAKLPVSIPSEIDKEALVRKLYTDKKVRDGKLRFVFQNGIGKMVQFEAGTNAANAVYSKFVSESDARDIILTM